MKETEKKGIGKRISDWFYRRRVDLKVWLYKRIFLVALGFLGLNAVDGYLMNYAQQLAARSGIEHSIESNPFLAPFVGHWSMSLKGILGLAIIGVVAKVRNLTPQQLFWLIVFSCALFLAIVIWNLYSLGFLRLGGA